MVVVRRVARWVAVLLLVTAAMACGPGGAGSAETDRPSDGNGKASGAGAARSTAVPPDATATTTRPGGEFCRQVADSIANAFSPTAQTTSTPEELREKVELSKAKNEQALDSAPSELRPDLETLFAVSTAFADHLASVGYDVARIDPRFTAGLTTPDVRAASNRVLAYLRDTCGIDLVNGTPSPGGSSSTTAASTTVTPP